MTSLSEADPFAELLSRADILRIAADQKLEAGQKADLGQYMTAAPIAQFMASLIQLVPEHVRLLDAGAGVGSLTAAAVAQICSRPNPPKRITATAFELDPSLADYLHTTFNECRALCRAAKIEFDYRIRQEDFIAAGATIVHNTGTMFADPDDIFNLAILNPPYHKINANGEHRKLLRSAGIETTNLYTAFLWLITNMLLPGGELVAITPRSFCNGTYFRPFRKAFLGSMAIRRIHIFESRKKAFDDVLQENIIFHAVKGASPDQVVVSSSLGPNDDSIKLREIPYSQVVEPDDPDVYIHIVADEVSHNIGMTARGLDASLDELGIAVSTGKVVDFRAKELLKREARPGDIPLIYPINLSSGYVSWSAMGDRKPVALYDWPAAADLLVPADWYVMVKRFSAKEEKRRVVAAVYDPSRIPGDRVGIENHVNYFHVNGGGLGPVLARGLAAFLNSTLVDEFFRQFSGHTQVNAGDLRKIKYPSHEKLMRLGEQIGGSFPDQTTLDRLVGEALGIMENNAIDPLSAKQKLTEATNILRSIGLPRAQQNDRSALTLLALLNLNPGDPWSQAAENILGITEMMDWFADHYGVKYAPNTRETVRRFSIHQFVQMGIVIQNPDRPDRPITSPNNRYLIDPTVLKLIRSYGSNEWVGNLEKFLASAGSIRALHAAEREMAMIPVKLPDGSEVVLSGGGQNVLIAEIIREFCSRYTPGIIAYLGDAGNKYQDKTDRYMREVLGLSLDKHGKMPDVIVHMPDKNWLVLIEAVTSHGPIDQKRHNELVELFAENRAGAGLVFVTAFKNRRAMVRWLNDIAWETEVWLSDSPSHLIHFNGKKFLGPYSGSENGV